MFDFWTVEKKLDDGRWTPYFQKIDELGLHVMMAFNEKDHAKALKSAIAQGNPGEEYRLTYWAGVPEPGIQKLLGGAIGVMRAFGEIARNGPGTMHSVTSDSPLFKALVEMREGYDVLMGPSPFDGRMPDGSLPAPFPGSPS